MSAIHEIEALESPKMHPHEVEFWATTYDITGKNLLKFQIVPLKFAELIRSLNFVRLDIQGAVLFVRIERGTILEEVQIRQIRDAVWDICLGLDDPVDGQQLSRDMILNKVLTGIKTLFDEHRLQMIRPDKPIKFIVDGKQTRYMFYRNCAVKVGAGMKYEAIKYEDLEDGSIWKNQIIPRDHVPGANWKEAVFYKFMQKVCGDDDGRVNDLMKITGYLLHGHDGGKMKMINFTDSAVAMGRESNGRSGKSLYALALAYALTAENPKTSKVVCNLNGKDFNVGDDHKYQTCGPETRIIILNDLKDNFNLKGLFNDITEGQIVNRKYQQPFRITAKMLAIGNEALRVEGESSIDRVLEFEFANFFSSKRSPADYFGHWFFTDWKDEEWAKFDALILHCMALWLNDPKLPEPKSVSLGQRKMREHTSPEFCDYMDSLNIQTADHYDRALDKPFEYNKKDMFIEFTQTYTDFQNRRFTMRRFTEWIGIYTKHHPRFLPFDPKRDEYKNDKDFFIMFRKAREDQK